MLRLRSPIYKGSESFRGVDPRMMHRTGIYTAVQGLRRMLECCRSFNDSRKGSTPKGCGEFLNGVDPSRIHRTASTPMCKGCHESLKGVDPPMIQRKGSTPM